MRIDLRTRLLLLVLAGVLLLTAINIAGTLWGYGQLRTQVAEDTSRALEGQAASYLQQLARERTDETNQTLMAVRGLAVATRDYIAAAPPGQAVPAALQQEGPNGWRWASDATTLLIPPDSDPQRTLLDLQASRSLESLLPGLARSSPEVARLSFLAASGVVQTFPPLQPADLRAGWRAASDPVFLASAPEKNPTRNPVWVPLHDSLTNSGQQMISVAVPIYKGDTFWGSVVADITLSRLGFYLDQLSLDALSFAFLVDGDGQLLAAPTLGQKRLLGRVLDSGEHGPFPLAGATTQALGPALERMLAQSEGSSIARLGGTDYILAYAPVKTLGWSLAIAEPRSSVTAGITAMTGRIDGVVGQARLVTLLIMFGALLLLMAGLSVGLRQWFSRPLAALVHATEAVASGDLRPIPLGRSDEIGQLARSFNSMTTAIEASRAEIMATNQRLELTVRERTSDLQLAVDRLEQSGDRQKQLLQALRDVSTPVIPVLSGVLVMPLIGQLDDQRMHEVAEGLLRRIERDGARAALIDVTGAPVIDTVAAQAIVRLVEAARMLGCEVMLVGIMPEVAQTLVALGVDLAGLRTAVDLQTGIALLTHRQGLEWRSLQATARTLR